MSRCLGPSPARTAIACLHLAHLRALTRVLLALLRQAALLQVSHDATQAGPVATLEPERGELDARLEPKPLVPRSRDGTQRRFIQALEETGVCALRDVVQRRVDLLLCVVFRHGAVHVRKHFSVVTQHVLHLPRSVMQLDDLLQCLEAPLALAFLLLLHLDHPLESLHRLLHMLNLQIPILHGLLALFGLLHSALDVGTVNSAK